MRDGRPVSTSVFDLPDHLAAKAEPALIGGDERHFAAIAESLEQSIAVNVVLFAIAVFIAWERFGPYAF